jgi:hypothetical protein
LIFTHAGHGYRTNSAFAERWLSPTASNCYAQLAVVKRGRTMRWYWNGEQVGMATGEKDVTYGDIDLVFGKDYRDNKE